MNQYNLCRACVAWWWDTVSNPGLAALGFGRARLRVHTLLWTKNSRTFQGHISHFSRTPFNAKKKPRVYVFFTSFTIIMTNIILKVFHVLAGLDKVTTEIQGLSRCVQTLVTVGLSINGCYTQTTSFMIGNKIDKSRSSGNDDFAFAVILEQPSFLLLSEDNKKRLCLQGSTINGGSVSKLNTVSP